MSGKGPFFFSESTGRIECFMNGMKLSDSKSLWLVLVVSHLVFMILVFLLQNRNKCFALEKLESSLH